MNLLFTLSYKNKIVTTQTILDLKTVAHMPRFYCFVDDELHTYLVSLKFHSKKNKNVAQDVSTSRNMDSLEKTGMVEQNSQY